MLASSFPDALAVKYSVYVNVLSIIRILYNKNIESARHTAIKYFIHTCQ